jgi:hypothetical protein
MQKHTQLNKPCSFVGIVPIAPGEVTADDGLIVKSGSRIGGSRVEVERVATGEVTGQKAEKLKTKRIISNKMSAHKFRNNERHKL